MMRFPVRLTADLALARFAPKSRPAQGGGLIQFVDAAEILHHDSNRPVSHEKIREINSSRSPVVWIGGSEPLRHPGISHLVRAITQRGHFVFLETDGTLLRRRIHEFQPVPRLFLTVRLEPGARRNASESHRPSTFELAAEGMRAARLSGFLICVLGRVHAETEPVGMAELVQYARARDVDGMVITAANGGSNSADVDAEAVRQKAAVARKLIGSIWWESFSRMVEPALSSQRSTARNAGESGVRLAPESRTDEEGVRIA
jgi:MoaA/NifB/PqqE/SkfB family radical SAM enzyme